MITRIIISIICACLLTSIVHSSDNTISSKPLHYLDELSKVPYKSEQELTLLNRACEHIKKNDFINRYVNVANDMFRLGSPVDYYYIPAEKSNLAIWALKNPSMNQRRAQAIKKAITWCIIQEKDGDFLRAFVSRGPRNEGSLQNYRKDIERIIGNISNKDQMKNSLDANGIVIDKLSYFKSIDLNLAVNKLAHYTHCDIGNNFYLFDGDGNCPSHLYALFMPNGPEKLVELATPVVEKWELYTNESLMGKETQKNLETEETKYFTQNPMSLYRKFLVREFLERLLYAIEHAKLSGSDSEEEFMANVYDTLRQGNSQLFKYLITRENHPSWSYEDVLIEAGIYDVQEQMHGKQVYLRYFAYGSNLQPILIKYLYDSQITVGRLIDDGFKIAGNFNECIKEQKDLPPSKRQNDPEGFCLNKLDTDHN